MTLIETISLSLPTKSMIGIMVMKLLMVLVRHGHLPPKKPVIIILKYMIGQMKTIYTNLKYHILNVLWVTPIPTTRTLIVTFAANLHTPVATCFTKKTVSGIIF